MSSDIYVPYSGKNKPKSTPNPVNKETQPFPNLSLADYRAIYRNDGISDDAVIAYFLTLATIYIKNRLKDIDRALNEEEEALYKGAVLAKCKVLVLQRYIDIDLTGDGVKRGEEFDKQIRTCQTQITENISLLLGINSNKVFIV